MATQAIYPRNFTVSQQDSLRGRLRRLRLFPGFVILARLGIAQRLHVRRTRRAGQEMKRLGLDSLLANLAPDALRQDPADLMFLYRTVGKRKPKRAIEFGSGQSTLFIAQAMHDAGEGHLWSLDADAGWLKHTEANLPDHLRPFVTFVHSPVVLSREHGIAAWRYTVLPAGPWNFVLIDGPELTDESRLSCDLLHLRLAPGATGFIDHRWRSAMLAKEHTSLRLRFVPSLESFTFNGGGR